MNKELQWQSRDIKTCSKGNYLVININEKCPYCYYATYDDKADLFYLYNRTTILNPPIEITHWLSLPLFIESDERWISIDCKLPSEGEWVWGVHKDQPHFPARLSYVDKQFRKFCEGEYCEQIISVTHWIHLPVGIELPQLRV